MERRYWISFIVIAFVIGLVIGFGSAFKASRVAELEKQVQQLTQDNADLRGKLAATAVPMTPAPGAAGLPAKP
jgi:hypothetical protein